MNTSIKNLKPIPGSRRGQPGRPRKGDHGIFGTPESGHSPGTPAQETQSRSGDPEGALARTTVAPVMPRLLDLHGAAQYLGISAWTVRDLEAAGTLRRILIPVAGTGQLRKILFDRLDLDRLVENSKESRT